MRCFYLTIIFVVILTSTCTKEISPVLWNNPHDINGVNWHPPIVEMMADTTVNVNDSLTLTAAATDNGTVVKYVWAKDGSTYADTTAAGLLRVAYSDSGKKFVQVVAIDEDGVVSAPDMCVIMVTLDAPVVTATADTTVRFITTTSIIVSVSATDNNSSGSIKKYYWDFDANGWDDSTDAASYTVTATIGGPVIVRWAARDDDGIFSYDTFTVLFSRPPASPTVSAPTFNGSWISFDWGTGKGSFPVTLSASNPDGVSDTLTYTLFTGLDEGSLTLTYSGRLSVATLENIDSSAIVYYRLVVRDLFGDSAVSTNTFVAPPLPSGVTDIDGNFYPAVTIGNQKWTTVNLRTTKFNDSTAIPLVVNGSAWSGLVTPGYCFYNNSTDGAYQEKWGALYNWHAVNTGKLAPAGWHVPTDADWTRLENYLIANGYNWDGTTSGNKIAKSMAAQTDWRRDGRTGYVGNDIGSNNSSGFSALPGGYRSYDGRFDVQSSFGYWWSATEYVDSNAYARYLAYHLEYLFRYSNNKKLGFSVRLVRD